MFDSKLRGTRTLIDILRIFSLRAMQSKVSFKMVKIVHTLIIQLYWNETQRIIGVKKFGIV